MRALSAQFMCPSMCPSRAAPGGPAAPPLDAWGAMRRRTITIAAPQLGHCSLGRSLSGGCIDAHDREDGGVPRSTHPDHDRRGVPQLRSVSEEQKRRPTRQAGDPIRAQDQRPTGPQRAHALCDRFSQGQTAVKPAHRHGGAGVWQHRAQQAADAAEPARGRESQRAVAPLLHGAQHREAGQQRVEAVRQIWGEGTPQNRAPWAQCGCQALNNRSGTDHDDFDFQMRSTGQSMCANRGFLQPR